MKKILFALLLLFCSAYGYSQRHYAGISALEFNYGTNIFGKSDNYLEFAVSKYKSRTAYWKIGLNYFEKSFDYESEETFLGLSEITTIDSKGRDYFIDAGFLRTISSNRSSIYLNLGGGAFTGVETRKIQPENKYDFLLGAKIETELECFFSARMAFLGRLAQYWSPLSRISKWNTVWNVGIKVLIY